MRQLIQKGTTQAIRTYARVRPYAGFVLSRPSSASVRVRTPSGLTDFVAATIASTFVAETVTTGPKTFEGDEHIHLDASRAQVKGRYLLVTTAEDGSFTVRCSHTGTSNRLLLSDPLPMDVEIGSKIDDIEISHALSSVQTSLEGEALLDWKATIDGVEYQWSEQFFIVSRVPTWELNESILAQRMPEIYSRREANDHALDEVIESALEEELLPRLRARGIKEENIVTTWPLVPAHVAACAYFLARNDPSTATEFRAEMLVNLNTKIDLALLDVNGWYDAPQSTAPDASVERDEFISVRYTR